MIITGIDCKNCTYYKKLQELEEENKILNNRNENLRIALSTYELPEVVKVLTDWRTGELQLQENKLRKYRKALEDIRDMAIYDCKRECSNNSDTCSIESCLEKRIQRLINEVLK